MVLLYAYPTEDGVGTSELPTLANGLKGNFKIDNIFSADNTIDNFTQGRANVGAHDETEDYDIEYGREANVTKYIK